MEVRAKAIAAEYIASGRAETRNKYGSKILPHFKSLDGEEFHIWDLDRKTVCRGTIREDGRSRVFEYSMAADNFTEVFTHGQPDLACRLGFKANYILTQNIILSNFKSSMFQLSVRVGELLSPIIPKESPSQHSKTG